MNARLWVVAFVVLTVSVTVASAGTKKHRRHHHGPAVAADAIPPYRGSWDNGPAHFVRLPNGLIVSSYECFTDEGYGRYRPCGASNRF